MSTRRVRAIGLIPGYMTEARYYREDAKRPGLYKHRFNVSKNRVRMFAMSDGSVLLKGRQRIHADDRRPGFERYVERNPSGEHMAHPRQKDNSFLWMVGLGLLAYWILQTKSAEAGSGGGGSADLPVWNPTTGMYGDPSGPTYGNLLF